MPYNNEFLIDWLIQKENNISIDPPWLNQLESYNASIMSVSVFVYLSDYIY